MSKSIQFACAALSVALLSALTSSISRAGSKPTTRPAPYTVLTTPHFVITITDNSPEGSVTSDDVTYVGVNRRTGASIRLHGSDWHTIAPDGTPGRFIGYRFRHGDITYEVLEEGELIVTRGQSDVLVDESGSWNQ